MTLRKIARIGHPLLREVSRPVEPEELSSPWMQALIDDLIETMRDASGAGLAAPQVHEPVRVCVIEVKDNPRYPYKPSVPLTVLVNPVLTPVGDARFDNFEGCLSVPDLRGVVPRYAELEVRALDRDGRRIEQTVRGITAGTFQHECDHLDGTLFLDRVEDPRTLCTWAHFQRFHEPSVREHVRAVVARYGS